MKLSAVKLLIVINVAVFLVQIALPNVLEPVFALSPLGDVPGMPPFQIWQLITYAFLHGSPMHIAVNMFVLWMFGTEIERAVGPRRLLICYFASVLTAALAQLFVPMVSQAEPAQTIGASGGAFGLLLAFAVLFPRRRVVLLIPPIPMPAWVFATGYALIELLLGITGRQASVAHFAHLGGLVGSAIVVATWFWKPPAAAR